MMLPPSFIILAITSLGFFCLFVLVIKVYLALIKPENLLPNILNSQVISELYVHVRRVEDYVSFFPSSLQFCIALCWYVP